jgi:uncharacterized protein DUF1918
MLVEVEGMSDQPSHAVVVGFDGSMSARTAATWAAREAASANRLAHAFRWPLPELRDLDIAASTGLEAHAREVAAAQLDTAVRRCKQLEPCLDVHSRLVGGNAVEALTKLTNEAELLVLIGFDGSGSAEGHGTTFVVTRGRTALVAADSLVRRCMYHVRDTPGPAAERRPSMRATKGDHIVIENPALGTPKRHGEVIEVIGQGDEQHYASGGTTATSPSSSPDRTRTSHRARDHRPPPAVPRRRAGSRYARVCT